MGLLDVHSLVSLGTSLGTMDFDAMLNTANQRLKAGNLGIVIHRKGNMLHLRGTLPPKPGSGKSGAHQQRIALGLRAIPEAIPTAEAEARKVSGLLALRQFDWAEYIQQRSQGLTIAECLDKFKFWYVWEHGGKESTYDGDYRQVFKRLPLEATPSVALFKAVILEHTEPNTRNRRRYALALGKLADFLGMPHNLRSLTGGYSLNGVNPRTLPTDGEIAHLRDTIPDPQWQAVFAAMACYGLRNHEALRLDLTAFPTGFVLGGKTGPRYVEPLFPEWAEGWLSAATAFPQSRAKDNQGLGSYVTHRLRDYIPFPLYHLRHCYARRAFEFRIDTMTAALLMGHSREVHERIYLHWVRRALFTQAYRRAITQPDRPKPPMLNDC